ncbi:MAG: hypothetical protein FWD68_04085 [Alphaproteobacteria bacterium]|nr:hypothetical protein [Alphaproteobacteria bacterium]
MKFFFALLLPAVSALVSLCFVPPALAAPDTPAQAPGSAAAGPENSTAPTSGVTAESLRQAAEYGNPTAQVTLAMSLVCARRSSTPQSNRAQEAEILYWFRRAADFGNAFAASTLRMLKANDTEAVLLTLQTICIANPGNRPNGAKSDIATLLQQLNSTSFSWPEQGAVSLMIPASWDVRTRPGNDEFYVSAGPAGTETQDAAAVNVQISLIALPSGQSADWKQSRTTLQSVTRPILEQSLEKTFDPKPFAFLDGTGWMVQFTDASLIDKPHQPGTYKFVASAVVDLDDRVFLVATVRFDDPSHPDVALAMALLSSLRFKSASHGPQEPFTFTTPQSQVIIKVTDTTLRPASSLPARPGSFRMRRADPHLILTGWLAPASDYKGLKEFWQSESRSPAYAVDLAPIRVEMIKAGPWEVIAFDVSLPEGTSANLRAERIEAGSWIDLHLSTTSTKPPAELRAELLTALEKIELVAK